MDRSLSVSIREHFDRISDVYYDIVDSVWYDVGYYHMREGEFLETHLGSSARVVIDAGCGPGRHTIALARRYSRVVALDLSSNMLANTRGRMPRVLRSRLDCVQAEIQHLPFKPHVADLILNMEVLEHLPDPLVDPSAAFREFKRVLRVGASLIVEAPLRRHLWWRLVYRRSPSWKEVSEEVRREYYEKFPLVAENTFRDERLDALLRQTGFVRAEKSFVRVLPAGLVERYPGLVEVDRILEKLPLLRRWAREAIWLAVVAGKQSPTMMV